MFLNFLTALAILQSVGRSVITQQIPCQTMFYLKKTPSITVGLNPTSHFAVLWLGHRRFSPSLSALYVRTILIFLRLSIVRPPGGKSAVYLR